MKKLWIRLLAAGMCFMLHGASAAEIKSEEINMTQDPYTNVIKEEESAPENQHAEISGEEIEHVTLKPEISISPSEMPPETAAPEESPAPSEVPVKPEQTEEAGTETPHPSELPTDATIAPEITPEATPMPELKPTPAPAEIEGWLLDAEGKRLLSGKLEELMMAEGEQKILVSTDEVIEIAEFPISKLREIELMPDPECFPGGDWRIVCSRSERLRDEYSAEEIGAWTDEEFAPLYIWVREELPQPTDDPAELQLIVHAENLVTGQWSNLRPSFSMESVGEGSENCDFAVIILDERIAMLSGNSYSPEEEGVYTVRLALMNEMGDIMDRSEKYTLWLDWSEPEMMIELSMQEDRTMHIYASDRVSGVAGLSLDGGESWQEISEVFSYTAPKKQIFPAGSILLRDNAGNISANASEIELKKIPSYGGGSGGSVSKDHAEGDGDTSSYSAYTLEIPQGEMTALNIGGEEIDLRLVMEKAGKEERLSFKAELTSWATAGAQDNRGMDTLLLRAIAEGQEEIIWKINGAVLRKLYNSDIAYLVLERDGEQLSLPTIGFTGGTRYAELKMMGASTREFDYEVHMSLLDPALEQARPGFNQSLRLLPGIWVEVDGERFQMLDRESTPEMYFYDVYCAPDDLTAHPYGAYPGTTPDGETEV